MRYVSLSSVDIDTPNKERVVRDKQQGLGLSGEVGRCGSLLNLGMGTLTVRVSDDVNKTSKEFTVPPQWDVEFVDDKIFDVDIETDTDNTHYYLLVSGNAG